MTKISKISSRDIRGGLGFQINLVARAPRSPSERPAAAPAPVPRSGPALPIFFACLACAAAFGGYKAYTRYFSGTGSIKAAAGGTARPAPEAVVKALAEAGGQGDLEKVYSGGMSLGRVLEQAGRGETTPEVIGALLEAQAKGDLQKSYSGGVTFKQILEEAGAVRPGSLEELLAEVRSKSPDKALDGPAVARIIEELKSGRNSPTLENAVAEARGRGELDKVYSDDVTFGRILEEASQGRVGPGIEKVLAGARARGDLDRIKVNGKSLARYLSEAEDLSRRADGMAAAIEAGQDREPGADPSMRDPAKVVPEMIKLLDSPEPEARLMAAQTLCDVRYAANAMGAVPALERIMNGSSQEHGMRELRDFAEAALKKIRFCDGSSLCKSKWRKK